MKGKKQYLWAASLLTLLPTLTGCYEDYVTDYDRSTIYTAYQWDLRSFVVGEDQAFKFTVALAGVMDNRQDRAVRVSVLDELVTENIADIIPLEVSGLQAIDGLGGQAAVGTLSGEYVSTALSEAGITRLAPLPKDAYTLEGLGGLTIQAGAHTAMVTVRATDAFIAGSAAYVPGFALGLRIDGADADRVPAEKSFAVIAVRCENKFYGYYSRAAHVVQVDADGNVSETDVEPSLVDDFVYNLTTVDATTVRSDKVAGAAGEMRLQFNGDQITVSSPDGRVSGTGRFNGAALLQDRELELQYTVSLPDGGRTEVHETLHFRNRIRDGVNEWKD